MTRTNRTYLAKSVDEAIAQAREELGAEAMLLNTRKVWHRGRSVGSAMKSCFACRKGRPTAAARGRASVHARAGARPGGLAADQDGPHASLPWT